MRSWVLNFWDDGFEASVLTLMFHEKLLNPTFKGAGSGISHDAENLSLIVLCK